MRRLRADLMLWAPANADATALTQERPNAQGDPRQPTRAAPVREVQRAARTLTLLTHQPHPAPGASGSCEAVAPLRAPATRRSARQGARRAETSGHGDRHLVATASRARRGGN